MAADKMKNYSNEKHFPGMMNLFLSWLADPPCSLIQRVRAIGKSTYRPKNYVHI